MKKIIFRIGKLGIMFLILLLLPVYVYADSDFDGVETETGFYYTVQQGDTLWDLSQRFNDSAWMWSDLWSQNPQIRNPHIIYPGQKIRLLLRQDIENFTKLELMDDTIEKPHDEFFQEPVFYRYSPIESIGFILQIPLDPVASILKAGEDKELISTGDMVFIKHLKKDFFNIGDQYFTYQTISPVIHPVTGKNLGTQYLFTGVVEITRVEPDFAVGKVVKTYRALQTGDYLMPYKARSPEIPITESRHGLYGNIVASQKLMRLFGDDTIVFIDKGSADGAKPGQIYPVFKQDMVDIEGKHKEKVQLSPILLGTIIVLDTEESTSTVLITHANQGIPLGAVFGIPLP